PFASVEEMNRALIEAWNRTVRPRDYIYFLGDFCFSNGERLKEFFEKLNGRITVVLGNHDPGNTIWDSRRVQAVYDYYEFRYNKWKFCLMHYPLREWNKMQRGAVHLHGHVHGKFDQVPWGRSFDVGVDSRVFTEDYRPVSIDEVIDKAQTRPILKH
ncbi:MAG: metallophosphoesterase, partial [Halobacteria archaeon]